MAFEAPASQERGLGTKPQPRSVICVGQTTAEEEMQVSKGQRAREEEFNFIVPWGDTHLGDRNPGS